MGRYLGRGRERTWGSKGQEPCMLFSAATSPGAHRDEISCTRGTAKPRHSPLPHTTRDTRRIRGTRGSAASEHPVSENHGNVRLADCTGNRPTIIPGGLDGTSGRPFRAAPCHCPLPRAQQESQLCERAATAAPGGAFGVLSATPTDHPRHSGLQAGSHRCSRRRVGREGKEVRGRKGRTRQRVSE